MTNMNFTCIGKGHGAPAIPATRKEWEELRNAPWLAEMCRRIAAGDESLKAKLPVWTPGCAEFKNNHRALADALKPLPRLLPEVFTREEAGAMRTRVGIRNGSLSQMLNNWKGRGYIELYGEEVKRTEVSRQRYIKTEGYLRKHGQEAS